MRQRRSRFNRTHRVITVRLSSGLAEFLRSIPEREIHRALRQALKGKP